MKALQQFLSVRGHWFGILFLLPYFAVEALYYSRRLVERTPKLGSDPSNPFYLYHLTPLTEFLRDSLVWIFWAGILAFVIHSFLLRRLGVQWFWVKMLALPFYFVAAFFWCFHPEW